MLEEKGHVNGEENAPSLPPPSLPGVSGDWWLGNYLGRLALDTLEALEPSPLSLSYSPPSLPPSLPSSLPPSLRVID